MTTTVNVHIKDDFALQDIKIKQTLRGSKIDDYIEAFVGVLLAAGFDQGLVKERLGLE